MTAARSPAAAGNLGRQAGAAAVRLTAAAGVALCFLIAGGALVMRLSGLDLTAPIGGDSRSFRSEVAFAAADLGLILLGVSKPRAWAATLIKGWPLLLLAALAIGSAIYAPHPGATLRRGFALAASVLAMGSLAARFPGQAGVRLLVRCCAAGILASGAMLLVDPAFAVHQATDGAQSVHAGDWRGLFIHRTVLGQLSAFTLATAIWSGRAALGSRTWQGAVILASAACVIGARSGGGVVTAVLLTTAPLVLRSYAAANRRNPLLAKAGLAFAGAVVTAAALMAGPAVLDLLGKDATLTGRVPVWRWMADMAARRPWLGYGYSSGFKEGIARPLATMEGTDFLPNAQNGYLDTLLNLGGLGLVLVLGLLAACGWLSLRAALRRPSGLHLVPLLAVLFTVEFNLGEAGLIQANDIFFLIYALVAFLLLQGGFERFDAAP